MSIVASSYLPGSAATKALPGGLVSVSIAELFSELVRRLTEQESLGLLSDIGKRLKSSLTPPVTDTQSTDGSAVKEGGCSTSTCPLPSGPLGLPKHSYSGPVEPIIPRTSLGQLGHQKDMWLGSTHGYNVGPGMKY